MEKECCGKAVDCVFTPAGQIINNVKLTYLKPDRIYPGLNKVSFNFNRNIFLGA